MFVNTNVFYMKNCCNIFHIAGPDDGPLRIETFLYIGWPNSENKN